ncbi:unnamed protein product [Cylindrotheca closterium]|uniref:Leucine-rich repeat protein n=1 Tax=Cylindrotheca closterium TaxID=2856 RepID=A0AAD2FNS8_9STRA|nr:unnamed protein product [Cylindrotheca closterium]
MASSGPVSFIYQGEDEDSDVPATVNDVEVASHVTSIHSAAFHNYISLTIVRLPLGLKVIEENAFNNCQALKTISIPSSVGIIQSGAFCDCKSLETAGLPEGLTAIPHACFMRCVSLVKVNIPSTVVEIGVNAFWDCQALRYVELPMGLETIESGAFGHCWGLSRVLVPSSVIYIGLMAFTGCGSLETVEISIESNALQSIRRNAFQNCYSLICVALPKSCDVNPSAFLHCEALVNAFERHGYALNGCLSNRFDGLPAHKFVYQQAHNISTFDSDDVSDLKDNRTIYPTDTKDVFGLTPFHILALSSRPNVETFQFLLKQASFLIDQLWHFDVKGKTALRYAIGSYAPGAMVFVNAVLHAMIDGRVVCLSFEPWRLKIAQKLNRLTEEDVPEEREDKIHGLFALIHLYERKETLSLLDQAVWKHRMRQSNKELAAGEREENAIRPKMDLDVSPINDIRVRVIDRQACYLHSGAETILDNTLPYLAPITKTIAF